MVATIGLLLTNSPAATAFTAGQLKTARGAYCQAAREQVAQIAPNEVANPQMLGDAIMRRALDRIQATLHLPGIDDLHLLTDMGKRYPDVGNAHSALEILSACEDSGD